jgi:hypothetical protein
MGRNLQFVSSFVFLLFVKMGFPRLSGDPYGCPRQRARRVGRRWWWAEGLVPRRRRRERRTCHIIIVLVPLDGEGRTWAGLWSEWWGWGKGWRRRWPPPHQITRILLKHCNIRIDIFIRGRINISFHQIYQDQTSKVFIRIKWGVLCLIISGPHVHPVYSPCPQKSVVFVSRETT